MLYVSFFPQLVAGPIERAASLIPQISRRRAFDWFEISSGAQLCLVGFFKKMVIADNLSPFVNGVYEGDSPGGPAILLATYAFAIQIYCDFSGYTDIARGAARLLGFKLMLNFDLPYFATSPSEFWHRWHISLSTWFRDYVYIPLGGNRGSVIFQARNLLLTMFLAGLWHGASWHFVVWGLYHGGLLAVFHVVTMMRRVNDASSDLSSNTHRERSVLFWIKAALFFQLTCFGWLIFRVRSMKQFSFFCDQLVDLESWELSAQHFDLLYWLLLFGIPLGLFQVYQRVREELEPWSGWPVQVRAGFFLFLFYGIVLLGTPDRHEFIYFQF